MSTPPPPARLHVLTARSRPVAVVLRRGPTKWYQVLLYHTDTDVIEYGPWFHGRLYEHRCDLSDDGRYLVYFAASGGLMRTTWTGVSEPPSLSPVMTFGYADTWGGGGIWTGPKMLAFDQSPNDDDIAYPCGTKPDFDFTSLSSTGYTDADRRVLFARLSRDGKVIVAPQEDVPFYPTALQQEFGRWTLGNSKLLPEVIVSFRGWRDSGDLFEFTMPDHPGVLTQEVRWAAWDCLNQLIVARGGHLERWTSSDFAAGEPSFSIDLSELTPPLGDHTRIDK